MLSEGKIKQIIKEEFGAMQPQKSIPPPIPEQPQEKIVRFDKNTDHPYLVKFSERGFSIGGTRLSFETLDNALSKGYNIVLENGEGLELDQIKMQKIMKYKDLY